MSVKQQNELKHVAIIMDGNRRWARKQGKPDSYGHKYMIDYGIERIVKTAIKNNIPYLTLWAFSTENWKRSKREVEFLMSLFKHLLTNEFKKYSDLDVKLNVLGDISYFSEDIQNGIKEWTEKTKNNKSLLLSIAINYGGRDEIVRGVSDLIDDFLNKKIELKKQTNEHSNKKWWVSDELLDNYMETSRLPPPDLIIRTGGEKRLSGFFLWNMAYSELYFTDVLLPDFDEKEFEIAIKDFYKRQRRFGK